MSMALTSPLFTRCADADELARAAATVIVAAAHEALTLRGHFRLALSGGRTPHATYARLARAELDWQRVDLLFSDERCVPADHADSNFNRARAAFAAQPAAVARLLRMPGELPPADGARAYAAYLQAVPPSAPLFDLCLLGLGGDGHCASLFPGDRALQVEDQLVAAARAPVAPHDRLTLTFPALARSAQLLFLVAGADKAPVLAELLAGGGTQYPAARAARHPHARFLVSAEAWPASS